MPREQIVALLQSTIAKSLPNDDWKVPLERGETDHIFVDAMGHHRPVYRPFMVYAWAKETQSSIFDRWATQASELPIHLRAWDALSNATLSKSRIKASRRVFNELVNQQQPSGALTKLAPHQNPEPFWFNELVLLHGVTSFAKGFGGNQLLEAAQKNAEYLMNETQPDHATSQPWAVAAFAMNANTEIVADQMIHAAIANSPEGLTGIPLLLLRDALYCLTL